MRLEIEVERIECHCGGYSSDGLQCCSICGGYEYYYKTEMGQILQAESDINEVEDE
jgi:hypothetical protein